MKNRRLISFVFLVVLIALGATSIQSQSLKRLKKDLKVWVKQDGQWGLMDGNQQWLIAPNANYADCINMYGEMAILELKNDTRDDLKAYQVIDFSGDTLLEFKAKQAYFFDFSPVIQIETNSGYGCINISGDTLVAPVYRTVSEDISDSTKFLVSNEDKKYGLIDNRGNQNIPMMYKKLSMVYNNRYVARMENSSREILISSNNEVLTNKTYETLFPISLIMEFENSIRYSELYANSGDNEYLVNTIDGEELFPMMGFLGIAGDLNWIPFQEGGKQGYKNRKGEVLFSKESGYLSLFPFSEGRAVFRKETDQYTGNSSFPYVGYGVMNKKGKEIVPPIYSFIHFSYNHGLTGCEKGGKYGLINKRGKVKIPFEYDYASNDSEDKLISINKDGKQGILNYRGKEVVPPIYNSILNFYSPQYFMVTLVSGKVGILDYKGREILPNKYDDIQRYQKPRKIIFKDFEE